MCYNAFMNNTFRSKSFNSLIFLLLLLNPQYLFAKAGKKMEADKTSSMQTKTSSANVIFSDYPDPDIIRVDDTYYMISTTMYFMPGGVILRSYNLVDWEIVSYVYDQLDGTPAQRLWDNKGIYSQGMWAASIRYHKGLFYVTFVANDTHQTYLYTSEKIEGPWKMSNISGFYHDMSILFDDDGRTYIVSGNTNIHLTEMEPDLSKPKKDGINKIIIKDESDFILGYEGSHFYKIKGKYYIFFIHWPKGKMRTEACFVSDKVDGPYTGCDVLCSGHGGWNSGVAQGGIVEALDGSWYGMLFQDHGALGRIPVLVPVKWENDFPVFGEAGKAPLTVTVPDSKTDYKYQPLYCNDFVDEDGKLCKPWQWNHIPDKRYYSFENDGKTDGGKFTLTTGKVVQNICQAANTLTQRTFTEHCQAEVTLDFSKLNDGDFAGLCTLEGNYGFIGVTKETGKCKLVVVERQPNGNLKNANELYAGVIIDSVGLDDGKITGGKKASTITLKVICDFSQGKENARFFYYNQQTKEYVKLGNNKRLQYSLDHFTGCRFALFNYATVKEGGSATFSDFKYTVLE